MEQSEQVERLLWQTLRQMRESADTARLLLDDARRRNDHDRAARFEKRLCGTERNIQRLYQLMTSAWPDEALPGL